MGVFDKIFKKKIGENQHKGCVDKEQLPSISEMKLVLCDREEKNLRKQYPDYDSWRQPQNFAEQMCCVGYAAVLLSNYKHKLEILSEDEIVDLYNSNIRE